jgi:hypothetical protein
MSSSSIFCIPVPRGHITHVSGFLELNKVMGAVQDGFGHRKFVAQFIGDLEFPGREKQEEEHVDAVYYLNSDSGSSEVERKDRDIG